MLCESNKWCNMAKMAYSLSLDSSGTGLFINLYVNDTLFYVFFGVFGSLNMESELVDWTL